MKTRGNSLFFRFLLWAVFALSLPVLAFAQGAPVVRAGNVEVGGFIGASYGIDKTRVMGGGNFCYGISRFLMPYVEYSYFPGIGRSQSGTFPDTGRPYTLTYSVPLSDFHGGVHLRIPIRESKVVPYGVIGVGVVHSSTKTVDAAYQVAGGTTTIQSLSVPGRSDFAANFGGGLRFYVSQRFGFRAEAKAYKVSGSYYDIFGKVEGGFFFLFR